MNWQNKIVSDKDILLGKPTIKGTRLSIEFILERLDARAACGKLSAPFERRFANGFRLRRRLFQRRFDV